MSCCEVESQAEPSRRGSCRKALAREANVSDRCMNLNQAQKSPCHNRNCLRTAENTFWPPGVQVCTCTCGWESYYSLITSRTHTSTAALTETFETGSKTARRVGGKRFPIPVCPQRWPTEPGNQVLPGCNVIQTHNLIFEIIVSRQTQAMPSKK